MSLELAAWWLALAAPGVVALLTTLFNFVVWPRGREDGEPGDAVSVLIPARDEIDTIEACVRSVFSSGVSVDEVVVCDDGSTDGTGELLAELEAEFDHLRLIQGGDLPAGWVGKPHACRQLEEAASGDTLVYVDADIELREGGLARLLSLLEGAEMATAVPRQRTESWLERLVVPLLHVTYTSWLPLSLIWRTDDPRFLAANGQLMALRREALEAVGGFQSVRGEVVDDVALARRMKRHGGRVVFGDGTEMATCRMYASAREVWEGFSKNLYEGIGESPVALGGVVGLYLFAFVVPYVALAGVPLGVPWQPAAVGVGANVVLRALSAVRFDHPLEGIVLHPVGVLALVAIAFNSFRWHRRGEIRWAGRIYETRANREASSAIEEEP